MKISEYVNMRNKEIGSLYFNEIWNHKNLDVAREIISPKMQTRFPKEHGYGPEGLMRVIKKRYEIFPDLKMQLVDVVEEGAKLWCLYEFSGTHKGNFWNIEPTERKVKFRGMLMLNVKDGKIISAKSLRDELTLLEQIGFISIARDGGQ